MSLLTLPIELIDLIFEFLCPFTNNHNSANSFNNNNSNNLENDNEEMEDEIELITQQIQIPRQIPQQTLFDSTLKDFLALRSVHPKLYRTFRSTKIFLKSVAEGQSAICQRMLLNPPAAGSLGPQINPSMQDNEAIISSCRNGFLRIANLLLADERVNPGARDQEAIVSACENGHEAIVRLLVQGPRKGAVNAACRQNEPIKIACLKGFTEIVDILLQLPYIDPGANKNQALLNACRNGHAAVIKKLAQKSPTKCDFTVQNSLALQVAVAKGDLELVQCLLSVNDQRVNPGAWDSAAFRHAVKNGFIEIARVLAVDPRVNVAAANHRAISDAAERGDIDLVKLVISDSRIDPSARDNAALKAAIANGHLEVVKLLLRDARTGRVNDQSMNEAFVNACRQGFQEIVGFLLAKGLDPSLNDSCGFRAAASSGHANILEMLLDDGRVNPVALNHEAFIKACSNGHTESVRLLLKLSSTDAAARDNEAIKQSASKGYKSIVQMLLEKGNNVNPGVAFSLPLRKAVSRGSTEIVKLILNDKRSNASACDNEAIQQACKNGYPEIVELLLKEPTVNPATNLSQCLKDACENGHLKVVKMLLADGRVDPSHNENYALHLAMQNRHYEIARILQSHQVIK